jgi:SAM-dependent methyltransferase
MRKYPWWMPKDLPMPSQISLDTQAGASVYSPLALKIYDLWVLGVSNRWAWQCPTGSVLLPFYRRHVGSRHLDVGAGTGFYLENAGFSDGQRVALLDLNENSLRAASRRLGRPDTELFVQDVMQPLTSLAGKSYDSIALFYLLHCLPGGMADKACVFDHLKHHLADDGVLYGATILGDDAGHNALGRKLMKIYNRKGIFGNRNDTYESLDQALRQHFGDVELSRHGKVACFAARLPRSS